MCAVDVYMCIQYRLYIQNVYKVYIHVCKSAIPYLFDRSKSALEQVYIQLLELGSGEGEREVDALVQGLDLQRGMYTCV